MLKHVYTDNVFKKKILIIGPYPPPFGGVEVHIKRIKYKLEKQQNCVAIFDTSTKRNNKLYVFFHLFKALFKYKPDIVYFHEPTMSRMRFISIVLYKIFFRYRLISIDHNCRILYNYTKLNKKLFRRLMKNVDSVVVIGDTTDRCYKENKIKTKNYSIESPFLMPNIKKGDAIFNSYPTQVSDFIKTRSPLISANAFTPVISKIAGGDLYGFDMCIELIKEIKHKYPNVGIIFGICKVETKEQKNYFEKIKQEIKKYNLDDNFYFFINNNEFWPIIKKSDLFVRPTLSDSFGISVKEAICLGVKAVASDVCKRPQGAVVFKTGDREAFVKVVRLSLSQDLSSEASAKEVLCKIETR